MVTPKALLSTKGLKGAFSQNGSHDKIIIYIFNYLVIIPVFMVAGEKHFHTIVSQTLVAMKSDMPEPRP